MKRVVMLAWLTASPAWADVEVVFTPSRPNSYSSYSNHPYASLDLSYGSPIRSYPHSGMWSARVNYFGGHAVTSNLPAADTGVYTTHARFGYRPHYPSYPSAYTWNKALLVPAPLPSGPPPCDPYTDELGCLDAVYY